MFKSPGELFSSGHFFTKTNLKKTKIFCPAFKSGYVCTLYEPKNTYNMMLKKFFNISMMLLVAAAILTAASCKKDNNDEKSKDDLLTSGSWKMAAWTIDPAVEIQGMTYTDLFAFLPDCSKDDFMTFDSDGTVVYDEGATKCDAGDPQTTTGTWMFNSDQTELTMAQTDSTEAYHLDELTDSKLQLSMDSSEDFGNGTQTYHNTITFVKK